MFYSQFRVALISCGGCLGHPDRLLLDGGAGLAGLALHQLEHGGLGALLSWRTIKAGLEGSLGELLPVVGPGVPLGLRRGGGALVNAESAPLGQGRGWGGLGGIEGVGLTNEGSRGSRKNLALLLFDNWISSTNFESVT